MSEVVQPQSQVFTNYPTMSPSIAKLAEALAKAQGEVMGAEKNMTNGHFKSGYADLGANIEATREAFSKHGLSVIQQAFTNGEAHFVHSMLLHSSGEYITSGTMRLPGGAGLDPQKTLAALTYFRRGQFAAICRLAQVDDDGNEISGKGQAPQTQPKPAQAQTSGKPANFPPGGQAPQAKPVNHAPQTRVQAQGLALDPETQARVERLAKG